MLHQLPLFRGLALCLFWLLLYGCNRPQPAPEPTDKRNGYRPVYLDSKQTQTVDVRSPQPLQKPGKIYVRGGYLLINERNKGIHVIDNRDLTNPVAVAFIAIPGNSDMALKDSTLFVNSGVDLLALNISDPAHIKLAKRLGQVLPPMESHPAATNVWFECADPAKGTLIGWEPAQLTEPKCYR